MRFVYALFVFVAFSGVGMPLALAHRVNIFAYMDGNTLHVDCGFSKSRKVSQGAITVFDAATNEVLVRGLTDASGVFRFPVPEKAREAGHGLRIRIDAGEGHQNERLVPAHELAASGASAGRGEAFPSPPEQAAPGRDAASPAFSGVSQEDLERMVNAALDAKLAPVIRMLSEQRGSEPELRDIIGGIGWIVGLAGIAAYYKRRS